MAKKVEIPVLETDRLLLKPPELKYADALEKHFNNWTLVKDLNGNIPWPYPKGGVKEHFKTDAFPRMREGKGATWLIFLKNNPEEPIGRIDLFFEVSDIRESNRGFWLAEPFWSQGIMTEAIRAVNDFAFDVARMRSLRLDNYQDNIGSHRIKEKTGAKLIRTEIQKWRGEDRVMEIWELTAEDWKAFRES
ncbi:MAG: GNAT family N-acetyltransferase [Pseudomonadota bacterium]